MNFKIIIIVIIILIAGIFIGVWYYSKKSQNQSQNQSIQTPTQTDQQTTQAQTLINLKPEDYQSRLEDNFQIAKSKATEWQRTAKFVFLQVSIPSDLNPQKVNETYVFVSSAERNQLWTINLDLEGNYLRAKIPKSDFLADQNLQEIAFQYWKLFWLEAFQKAEANGGKEFREKAGNNLEITANLGNIGPRNFLAWEIKYQTLTEEVETKTILIDAYSGEIFPETAT